jgi:hypothetical protein
MSTWVSTFEATQTFGTKLTTTNATAVYTNANKSAQKGLALNIVNTSAGAITVTVAWYDASATTAYAIVSGFSLGANTTMPGDILRMLGDIRLDLSDEIRVTASGANTIEVIVSVTDFQSPGRAV